MLPVLRKGTTSADVLTLQKALATVLPGSCVADGVFGPRTEAAVVAFQEREGLYADGVVGKLTWIELSFFVPQLVPLLLEDPHAEPPFGVLGQTALEPWETVKADAWWKDAKRKVPETINWSLRQATARKWFQVVHVVQVCGGKMPGAGGKRNMKKLTGDRTKDKVGASQVVASMHCVGDAGDLATNAMQQGRPDDPYVTQLQDDRSWRVLVRVKTPMLAPSPFIVFGKQKDTMFVPGKGPVEIETTGEFLDLTALFMAFEIKGIKARTSYMQGREYGGCEAWHMSNREGLVVGKTRYGDLLLRVYRMDQIRGTLQERVMGAVYGDGFGG